MLAADYPFLEVMWTMFVFFLWVMWLWLLFSVFADIFRRDDLSGMGKAGWLILTILLPFLGVFIYMIANGGKMQSRALELERARRSQFDDYVRETAGSGGAAAEIARAKELLDSGAIDQAEYEALKSRALA